MTIDTRGLVEQDRIVRGKNLIINGNFDIWQRGVTQSTDGILSADRWYRSIEMGSGSSSRVGFPLGDTDVPGNPKYYHRNVVSTIGDSTAAQYIDQSIESVRTAAGQTVTVSFYAKADAAKNLSVELVQGFGTGGTPSTSVDGIGATKVALTTSWQKFTVVASLPSISGKTLGTDGNDRLRLVFWFDAGSSYNARTASLGNQSGTFDIAQVQLEIGPVATDFERRTVGEELALCQRYYETRVGTMLFSPRAATAFFAGTGYLNISYVEKRATPVITLEAGTNITSMVVTSINKSGAYVYGTPSSISAASMAGFSADAEF